jgi:hypothetical protein
MTSVPPAVMTGFDAAIVSDVGLAPGAVAAPAMVVTDSTAPAVATVAPIAAHLSVLRILPP